MPGSMITQYATGAAPNAWCSQSMMLGTFSARDPRVRQFHKGQNLLPLLHHASGVHLEEASDGIGDPLCRVKRASAAPGRVREDRNRFEKIK